MKENLIQDNKVYNYDASDFLHSLYEDYGDESVDMFLCDFPYTFKGKNRVTANKWDLPIDDKEFFDIAIKMLTPEGCIALTASQPFTSYLVMNHLEYFKYEWIWEKDNGSNFVHVKHQPFKVHESVLIFGKAPTTYNKAEKYMKYNPQFSYDKPYIVKRDGSDVENLVGFGGVGEYKTKENGRFTIYYQQWKNMLLRCYVKAERHHAYEDAKVCEEWLNFQVFAEWYDEHYYKIKGSLQIDKDIKCPGNTIYSSQTCILIPQKNKFNVYKSIK